MSPSDEPVKIPTSSKDSQRTHHYILKPCLHPHGWKLEVREAAGSLLFEVIRHPTTPTQYKLQTLKPQKTAPMKIKSTTIEDVSRYTLFKGNHEQLSIRSSTNSPVVLLRNQQRKAIARFSPLSPEVVLLRTHTASVARLRFKEKPAPLHFQVECKTEADLQWLYAIILYSIAQIETPETAPLPETEGVQDEDEASESNETVTP